MTCDKIPVRIVNFNHCHAMPRERREFTSFVNRHMFEIVQNRNYVRGDVWMGINTTRYIIVSEVIWYDDLVGTHKPLIIVDVDEFAYRR